MAPTPVLLVGAGWRGADFYAPILRALPGVELVGVVSRGEARARVLAEREGVPFLLEQDLDQAVARWKPALAIICVSPHDNGRMGRRVVELGLPALLETPAALTVEEAVAIHQAASARGLPTEVAEQNFRTPMEALKRAILQAGWLGEAVEAFSDLGNYRYHAISMLRAAVGFERPVLSVHALANRHATPPHPADGQPERREERFFSALIRFEGGRMATFRATDTDHDSPLRWGRQVGFYATGGMAIGAEISGLEGGRRAPVRLERTDRWVDGVRVTERLEAHFGARQLVWQNPVPQAAFDDDRIAISSCLLSLLRAMEEGSSRWSVLQGAIDQALMLAIDKSARRQGLPVGLQDVGWPDDLAWPGAAGPLCVAAPADEEAEALADLVELGEEEPSSLSLGALELSASGEFATISRRRLRARGRSARRDRRKRR